MNKVKKMLSVLNIIIWKIFNYIFSTKHFCKYFFLVVFNSAKTCFYETNIKICFLSIQCYFLVCVID